MFTFRQFVVHDDRCAMKVGTDGVLLGAWAQLCADSLAHQAKDCESPLLSTQNPLCAPRVLDVGCGCGLIALMLAQRFPDSRLVALEIEPEAAAQAAENVNQSPFAAQIEVRCGDFLHDDYEGALRKGELFDAIVSNPPFFEETLLSHIVPKRVTPPQDLPSNASQRAQPRCCVPPAHWRSSFPKRRKIVSMQPQPRPVSPSSTPLTYRPLPAKRRNAFCYVSSSL